MRHVLLITISLLISACASTGSKDRLEAINRTSFEFNTTLDKALLKPVAQIYDKVVPSPAQKAIDNFFGNFGDSISLINAILQLNITEFARNFMRVSLNSTFGIFGLWDFASEIGIERKILTLGDTFKFYGWRESTYLVLPLVGPTTVRDILGHAITQALFSRLPSRSFGIHNSLKDNQINLTTNIYAMALYGIHRRSKILGFDELFYNSSLDPYSTMRDIFFQINNPTNDDLDIDDLVE